MVLKWRGGRGDVWCLCGSVGVNSGCWLRFHVDFMVISAGSGGLSRI